MVVMTALFAFNLPFNALSVMITFLGLVSLDFIDTDFLLEEMFDFRETDAFGTYIDGYGEPQSHFADAGFETSNFIELLGSVFFVILLYAGLQLVLALLKIIVRPCALNKVTRWIRKEVHYKLFILRFLLEGCVELGLSSMIQILSVSEQIHSQISCMDLITDFAAILLNRQSERSSIAKMK